MSLISRNRPSNAPFLGSEWLQPSLFWEGDGYSLQPMKKRDINTNDMFGSGNNHFYENYDSPSTYSEEEMLANTLYIFLLLVMLGMILGGVTFAIREYTLSTKMREEEEDPKEQTGDDTMMKKSNPTKENQEVIYQEEIERNKLQRVNANDPLGSLNSSTLGSTNSGSISPSIPLNSGTDQFLSKNVLQQQRDANGISNVYKYKEETVLPFNKIEVIQTELNSTEFNGGSLTKYLNLNFSSTSPEQSQSKSAEKVVYTFKELYDVRDAQTKEDVLTFAKENDPVQRSILSSTGIPATRFQTAYLADKLLNENIPLLSPNSHFSGDPLLDGFLKNLSALVIISIGLPSLDFNPNYFLNSFSELVLYLVDTGKYFNLLEEIYVPSQQGLTSMILCFCWSQWTYRSLGYRNFAADTNTTTPPPAGSSQWKAQIDKSFRDWKLVEPSLLSSSNILRVLLNLELGFHGLKRIDELDKVQFIQRNRMLLTHICASCHCNDYLGFLPLLAQAINVTAQSENKLVYYDLVFDIVNGHGDCCMSAYIRDGRTDLKAAVQHGMWTQQYFKVSEKANKILYRLVEFGYSEVGKWVEEIQRGRVYVPSTIVYTAAQAEGEHDRGRRKESKDKPHVSTKAEGKMKKKKKSATPGSWNFGEDEEEEVWAGLDGEDAGAAEKKGGSGEDGELRDHHHRHHQKEEEEVEMKRSPSLRRFGYQ